VDTVARGRAYLRSLGGRRVAVVGLARSGVAAARLLRAADADVVGVDAKPLGALGREVAALAEIGVRLHTGAEGGAAALAGAELFQPRVAVVLNLAPDHLDRHGSFEAYVDAKARIFANQTPADCAVLNFDDESTRALADRTAAPVLWFSRRSPMAHGVFVRDGWIAAKLNGHVEEI